MRKVVSVVSVIAFLMVGSIISSEAMASGKEDVRAQFEHAYTQLLTTPADRKLNVDYAALAIQLKDYEAAISPLERILMHEPNNAKIRLQIGVLYHLLKSDVIARQYFEATLALPDVPSDVATQAQGYLHGI